MALSALEKESLRRGIAEEDAFNDLYTIINGGSAAAIPASTENALKNAIAHDRVSAEIISAIESGGATLGAEAAEVCRRLMGGGPEGDSLVTHIEAIT